MATTNGMGTRMKNYEEGSRFIFGWTFPKKRPQWNPVALGALHHCWDVLLGHSAANDGVLELEALTRVGLVDHAELGLVGVPQGKRELLRDTAHKNLELHDLTSQNCGFDLANQFWVALPIAKKSVLAKSHTVQILPSASCGCTTVPPAL